MVNRSVVVDASRSPSSWHRLLLRRNVGGCTRLRHLSWLLSDSTWGKVAEELLGVQKVGFAQLLGNLIVVYTLLLNPAALIKASTVAGALKR